MAAQLSLSYTTPLVTSAAMYLNRPRPVNSTSIRMITHSCHVTLNDACHNLLQQPAEQSSTKSELRNQAHSDGLSGTELGKSRLVRRKEYSERIRFVAVKISAHVPLRRCCPLVSTHGVTTQTTSIGRGVDDRGFIPDRSLSLPPRGLSARYGPQHGVNQ